MTDKKNQPDTAVELRRQAEEKLRQEGPLVPESFLGLSPEEISQKLHELRVYQIELEMQNEALRRTQEELRDSRARYFDLYDLAPVGYVTLSETGLILETNLTAATLLCKARNELGKRPVSNFILKEDQDIYYRHREQLFKTGEPQSFELRMVRPEEPPFWARLDTTATQDKDGSLTCRVVMVDITEQKQAEEALRASEQRLDGILYGTNSGTWEWNVQTGETIFNERWANIIGYTLHELEPISIQTWIDFTHPDDLKVSNELLEKHFKREIDYYEFECRMKHKDGNWVWVLDRGRVISWTDDNKPLTISGTHQDITERKQAEDGLKQSELELVESEEKYRSIMESMKEPLYIGTQDFIVRYMNPPMIKRTGHDATGENCFKAIHDLDERCPWCHCEHVMVGNVHEIDIVSPKDKHSFHISITPIANNDGSISSLNVFRDVTEFKKMEARLHQAQKMESIGTLAGGIAHDFNNILFPIVGHTEMLLEDVSEDSPFRASLNEIYTGALRASELVKQILTFSRQESGELKLMKMQPIIKEALKLIRSTIPTTIEIKQNISPACGVIKADPTKIHQIIMNLSTNAYHAMEEIGGELKVSLNELELSTLDLINPDMATGVYVCLTVSDTGKGMDKNVINKIFDPFFTTKEKGKGTGLGLSVIHGIVTSMNGTIQVYSEPGKGTVFNVYIPVEKSYFTEQISNSNVKIQGGTEKILLVDDEETIISMERLMLERLGYHVTSRTSSIEALEAFRAAPDKFDLVITDMAMPNMPGNKLSAELIKIRPDIPVLLCTGFSETMSEEKAVSIGIKGFLWKPIIIKDLAKKIREVLDESKVL